VKAPDGATGDARRQSAQARDELGRGEDAVAGVATGLRDARGRCSWCRRAARFCILTMPSSPMTTGPQWRRRSCPLTQPGPAGCAAAAGT
jgi:hypothetical protein